METTNLMLLFNWQIFIFILLQMEINSRIGEIQEVINNHADLKKPNERFAVFKLKENREFGMVFWKIKINYIVI